METAALLPSVASDFQTEAGIVTLPVGTQLQFVSGLNTQVRVHYLNSDYDIPAEATNWNGQP
jgi:hypothetical protein